MPPLTASRRHPLWLLAGFWFCFVVSLGVVLRRLAEMIRPSQIRSSQMAIVDANFSSHGVLTALHILPASIFVVLAGDVLLRSTRGGWPERLFFPLGAITGVTAYAMSYWAIGGWIERSAAFVFDSWVLFSLSRAFWLRLQGERWQMR